MAIQDSFSYIIYAFYSHYSTVWIANMEIGLDPNTSVVKRLWCIFFYRNQNFVFSVDQESVTTLCFWHALL